MALSLKLGGILAGTAVTIGTAIVAVPLILNMGFGYVDTIDRVSKGEDVEPTYMLDAAEQGIKPGATSEQAERVLGHESTPVDSEVPGEKCGSYDRKETKLVVCYATTNTGPNGEARWLVTRSWVAG